MMLMTMPHLRAPIVLVHGLFGFGHFRLGRWVLAHYFIGLPPALEAVGNRVLIAKLSRTCGIATRASQLKQLIDQSSPDEPVHILAHSMGGLDARYMISRLGMANRVLSLTTLGTPHRGTPFADWAIARLSRLFGPVLDRFGVSRQAFDDLTVERCKQFNSETPDAPGVRYFSVAGHLQRSWINPAWPFSSRLVAKAEGPNDGMVSVASAQWGETLDLWDSNHMNLVNWPQPRHPGHPNLKSNRLPAYAGLLGRLRDEGM
jgi:triacylglycerol lipase